MIVSVLVTVSGCQKVVVCADGTQVSDASQCVTAVQNGGKESDESQMKSCPATCDDSNACTSDICNVDTGYQCVHTIIKPCCSNGICEKGEDYTTCKLDCRKDIAPEIVELQEKAALKNGISYSYRQVNFNEFDAASSVVSFEVTMIDNYTRYTYPSAQYYKWNTPEQFLYNAIVFDSGTEQAFLLDVVEYATDYGKRVRYEDYYIKNAKEYLMEITEGTFEANTGNYDGRDTSTIIYPLDKSVTRTIKIGNFDGLPLLIEDYDNDREYLKMKIEFKSLSTSRKLRGKDVWLPDDVETEETPDYKH